MDPTPNQRERDLVLAPGEFSFVLNSTNGQVNALVGPFNKTVANTDYPVLWNPVKRQFERCDLERAKQVFPSARQGEYVVLHNPAKAGAHPEIGSSSQTPALEYGRRVVVPGPAQFALFPGQSADIIAGHILRSNQYLIVRIVDETDARTNWNAAIVKAAVPIVVQMDVGAISPSAVQQAVGKAASELAELTKTTVDASTLAIGQLFVIKGTDVSFYIPPTGVEVVPDESGQYVRDAVTLERLEHCVLLGENGEKRYVRGPEVVFPSPTETFVVSNGQRKFRAVELNDNSGIYVKVIADYTEDGETHKVGDELFITGKQQAIYYPRPEHLIIKYGETQIHYAIAIPSGEGRYVLDRVNGKVELVCGPRMFLPDPRTQVVVKRVLDTKTVQLWYPGNHEAVEVNNVMTAEMEAEYISSNSGSTPVAAVTRSMLAEYGSNKGFMPDVVQRKQGFSKPRTITLNTKYDGAVSINIWTGYAVLVTDKTGNRRVEVGPKNVLLAYDETLMAMELSTGKPKTTDTTIKTVYLRVTNNRVSDLIDAETADLCPVRLKLSYRCDFEGTPERWFEADNYVKLFCDHIRSMLRKEVKRHGIQSFYAKSIDIIRDTILGKCPEIEGEQKSTRPGLTFEENGLRVYDVEVLGTEIMEPNIRALLTSSQLDVVKQQLDLESRQRVLEFTTTTESIARLTLDENDKTRDKEFELQLAGIERKLSTEQRQAEARATLAELESASRLEESQLTDRLAAAELARDKASEEQALLLQRETQRQSLEYLVAETDATIKRGEAFKPDLIAALQSFGDKRVLEGAISALSPLAIMGGTSVVDVLSKLLKGIPGVSSAVEGLSRLRSNGDGTKDCGATR